MNGLYVDSFSPLTFALKTSKPNFEIVKFLLDAGSTPDLDSLRSSVISGNLDLVKLVCDEKLAPTLNLYVLLKVALRCNNLEIVKYFEEKIANSQHPQPIPFQDYAGLIVQGGQPEMIDYFIQKSNEGELQSVRKLLKAASFSSKLDVIKYLIERFNLKETEFIPCIFKAISGRAMEVLKFFLEKKIDFEHQDEDDPKKNTPLCLAAYQGMQDIVKLLVEVGKVKLNATNKDGESPLFLASHGCWREIVEYLISKGAPVNQPNNSGRTPLQRTILSEGTAVMKLLVSNGANIHCVNENGESLLMICIQRRSSEFLNYLITQGVDVNKPNNFQQTPLWLAAECGLFDMVQRLLKAGADFNLPDKFGNFPVHIATKQNNFETVQLLVENGAEFRKPNLEGMNALMICSSRGNFELFKFFVDHILAKKLVIDGEERKKLFECSCEFVKHLRYLLEKGFGGLEELQFAFNEVKRKLTEENDEKRTKNLLYSFQWLELKTTSNEFEKEKK